MSRTKVLNLYAGIGGNRKLWEDVDVTAVEWDEEKAEVYRDHFPNDEVIVTDAHEYLLDHIKEYDFIWASPPCPTHSKTELLNHSQHGYRYPDMDLYEEIIILKQHAESLGLDYVVENVVSYYEPLIEPKQIGRHYFWSNYVIAEKDIDDLDKANGGDRHFDYEKHADEFGYDLSGYDIPQQKRNKMLANCVHPELGKHVFESRGKQTTLL